MRYTITLEVESDTDPRGWYYGDTLIIDEEYEVKNVEEVNA